MTLTAPAPPRTPAAPRYATPATPGAKNDGARIGLIASGMGKPFMPWQSLVTCVATERDAFGRLRYEIVLVTVPRQSGKTTLVGPVQIDRCVTNPDIKTFYTAQTGKDARSRFNDLVTLVKRSPLESMVTFRYSAGDEGIAYPNGSKLKIFAPTESAIHGETPPLVTLDEIWEYDEALGDAMLEDAIFPAQITLAGNRQVWLISTAGTALSTFMKKWVDRGRKQVEAQRRGEVGPYPKLAYFEWSMPEGLDCYDPEVLASFHPAVGYTITVDDLLQAAKNTSRPKWLRSFCNVWTEAANTVMPLENWDALAATPEVIPKRSQIAITYEVAPDNECAAVMATWRDEAGEVWTRVLHAAPGTLWIVDLLVKLFLQWRPIIMGADDGGETRAVTDELRRRLIALDGSGVDADNAKERIRTISATDFGTACVLWLKLARDEKTLHHDGSRSLRFAIASLVLRKYGDLTRFSRTHSTGPIAAAIASAVGMWLYDHREAPIGKPELRF